MSNQLTNATKNQSRNNLGQLSESDHTSQHNSGLPPPNETIGEEFLRLSLGFRVRSSRGITQTVQERKMQEQKEQLKQKVRRNSSKPKKKPFNRKKSDVEFTSANDQLPNRGHQSSFQVQTLSMPIIGTSLLQSASTVYQTQQKSKVAPQTPIIPESPQIRVVLNNHQINEWPKSNLVQPPKFLNLSPAKIKLRTSTYDKEFTEQLQEFKVLDKVMPCLDHVKGVFVQIIKSQEFATVLDFNNKDLLNLQTQSGQNLEVPIQSVKFLTGAYVHPLSEIAMANASDPLAIDLALTDQSKLDKNIILIQAISNPISEDGAIVFGSIHRLHAIVLNGLTGKMALHPVQFPSGQKNSKRQQKQALSAQEDSQFDNHESFCYQNQEVTRRVLDFSRQIQTAYKNYKAKVQSIQLTIENHKTLLNSLCEVKNQMEDEKYAKYGVLTNVHQNKAFIRYFRSKAELTDEPTQEWLNLNKVNIFADLALGFVSLNSLAQQSIFDTKLRNVKFESQLESKYKADDCQINAQNVCKTCMAGSADLLYCQKCNLSVHYDCLDYEFQSKLKPYKELQLDQFRCGNCLTCKECNSKVADHTDSTWSSDFLLCQKCEKKREMKIYCIGCLKFWEEGESTQEHLIQCSCCQMKIHPSCDRMFEDHTHLKQLQHKDEYGKPTTLYACFSCRQRARADFICQIVNYMMSEDKRDEFRYPFWQQPGNQSYLTIIKTPLCFNIIKQEIDDFITMPQSCHQSHITELKYLSKPEKLGQEIDLLFWNAKTFNQPQSEIYKLAIRMHEKCTQILNQGRIKEILKDNSLVTHDELLHLKFLRGQQTYEPEYKLKPKDLFQMNEQIDVNQYLYMIKIIEEQTQTVSLGKRSRENLQAGIQKRQRIDEGEIQLPQDLVVSQQYTDTKKIFSVANKRLLEQNLSKLRLNQQSSFPSLDKAQFKPENNNLGLLQQSPRSKWKSLMDSLRLSDEGDSCWYSNPVRVSFDDPSLIFEEMCYLCGSFGLMEEFLCCNLCGESYHPYCLPCPKDMTQTDKNGWFCYNCVFCEKCHSSKQYKGLVLCAVCDQADHYWCLSPPLVEVPECSWKCPDCFECRACGTKEFFSPEDIENKVNLDPNQKYTLSFDFEFCFQCGQDQYRKSFCKICEAKSGLELTPQNQKKNFRTQTIPQITQRDEIPQYQSVELLNQNFAHSATRIPQKEQWSTDEDCQAIDLFKCVTCKFYSHLSCSRTNLNVIQQLSQKPFFKGYQCLDCILSQKLPGFYLHEQCELYEDMHTRVEKFSLVSQLCTTILSKYTKGEQMILQQYIAQNNQWIATNVIVNKWIELLRSEVDYETSENSQTAQQNTDLDPVEPPLPFGGLQKLMMGFQNESRVAGHIPKARDMYSNLYKKVNGYEDRGDSIPTIEFSEEWLKPSKIDYAEIYMNIEILAISIIRRHFFDWVQNSVVGPAIEHQDLFFNKNTKQLQNNQITELKPPQVVEKPLQDSDVIMLNSCQELCKEEDVTIVNPQNRLTCILCLQSGEKRITGRLIPFQVNQFVHVNCAMWTSEVKEGTEDSVVFSELYNFYFAFKFFRNNVCAFCGLKGATLICANYALNRKCAQPFFHFPCAYKSGLISFQSSIEVFCNSCTKKENELQPGLPIKFKDYHRRRFIIVKNNKPQCTEAFKNDNGVDTSNKQLEGNQPQQYIVNCNKWRPYYYDMFNRAGNLTIISLSQSANRTIEALHKQNNQQITWHDRLKKVQLTESPSDFASIRITWKDFEKNKGFFLFTQNETRLIQSKDARQIVPFMNQHLRNKLNLNSESSETEVYSLQKFWEQQIEILRHRYQNFCLESTYLTPQNIQGLEKYPIQFWNNPSQKTGVPLRDLQVANFFYKSADLVIERQQLYTQKSQTEAHVQFEQPAPQGDLHSIFKKILDANKFVNNDGFSTTELENLRNPKWKNKTDHATEAELKQKLSSLKRFQPVLNQISVKWMNYNQVMGCLGKKTMSQRKIMREAQTLNLLYDSEDEFKKTSTVQQMIEPDISRQLVENARISEQNLAMRFRTAKARPKQVEVWTSKIHRNGLFACQPLNPKDIVIEYVGEKITVSEADRREIHYDKIGVCDCYFFSLDQEFIIDATFYGSKARYINHSCEPNLTSDKIEVEGKMHIVFTANRHIEKDEELTFNYSFEFEEEKIECFCGASICMGRLN